jgi:hypothetical protein
VVSAVYAAESEDSPVSTETLLTELSRTQPLSVVMAEPIAELKEWASGRTVPAH